ncbi:MAG: glycosyltransferase N-terminal domain-containing protein [Phycisphaerales bacterium]|jgi:3-deoxy-D-manno-octulosonic-acid transferase|nr:glycosyltransferase N-terminal domain-containing protein [Phycisphaerales bacterium]
MPRPIDAAYLAAAIVASPLWLPRMISTGKIRTDWPARFGRGPDLPATARPRVLLHAVSVGEVNATDLLVDELQREDPAIEPIVATTTDTGFARASTLFEGRCEVVRYPFDTSGAVRRLFDRVGPDAVGLIELEVWPNFLKEAAKRDIPVAVVNGRLSERSHRRYARLGPIARGLFRRLTLAAVQDETYADRFRSMGIPSDRVKVTGSMKWDTARIADDVPDAHALADAMGIDPDRPLVVAGSTAPIEHRLLHEAVGEDAQLLCAPRRPEWFDAAATDLPGCARRSTGDHGSDTDRFLLDTIGELRMAYALADIVVVGRTFGDLGGSDMIEPIALGKPTIIGPDVTNFTAIASDLRKAGGLVQTTPDRLGREIRDLLSNTNRAEGLVRDGREYIRTRQGATSRHSRILRDLATCGTKP